MKRAPQATLSLDLDDQWTYMKTHGDEGWSSYPSYLDRVVPRVLELLDSLGLRITFFLVGRDAEQPANREVLRAIADAGHEIANHSYSHEPWFHTYDRATTEAEVVRAERAIEEAMGQRPRGWRGPGFSSSPRLLEVLRDRGYTYDASTFPTFLGPIARWYHMASSPLRGEERKKRAELFGGWRDALRPLRPFRWQLPGGGHLAEVPVTTMPLFRTPIHLSYVHYLATFSERAASAYFGLAMSLCRWRGVSPSLLLHPTDVLGAEDTPELHFFPAMNRPRRWKERRTRELLERLAASFEVSPIERFVRGAGELRTQALPPQPLANATESRA